MNRKPTSPGEILNEEFLIPLGMTQKQLAEHLDCDYKAINRLINERAALSPEMAVKLALTFSTTPDFWLNAQMAVDLWRLRSKKWGIRPLFPSKRLMRRKSESPRLKAKRRFGSMKGKLKIPKDFDAPLPKDLEDAFYSGKF